jgi:hypothetical protein
MVGRQAEQALGLRQGGRRRPSPAAGLDQGLGLLKGRGKEWVHHEIVCRPPRGAVLIRHLAHGSDDNWCFIQYSSGLEIDMRHAPNCITCHPSNQRVPRWALHARAGL